MRISGDNGNILLGWILGLSFIGFLSSVNCLFSTVEDSHLQFVAGAERTTFPDPLFYSTYFPLIYEVDVPFHNISVENMKVHWPANFSTTCEWSPEFQENWESMACPVAHFMLKTVEEYYSKVTAWMSLNSTSKTSKIELPSCFEITPHFPSFTIGHEALTTYLDEDLRSCPLGQVAFLKAEETAESAEISTTMYGSMLGDFINEYVSLEKNRVIGFDRFPVTVNAYMALQSLQVLDFVQKSDQWTNAVSTCQAGRIPQTLIPRRQLADGLQMVQNMLSAKDGNNFIPTINPDDFSTYYKLKIADCAFTTRGTYLVRILVPLRREDEEYKLSLMTPLPFLRGLDDYAAEVCQYTHSVSPFLVETRSGFTINGGCDGSDLCIVPQISDRPVMNYCLHALVLNNTEEIVDKCEIQCHHFNLKHLPYFRRLSSNKYAVVGGKIGSDIFISCAGQPFKKVNPSESFETLEITLPCGCHIVHGKDTLHASIPCSETELRIKRVLPLAWSPSFGSNNETLGLNPPESTGNKGGKMFIGGYKRRNVSKRPISLSRLTDKEGKSRGWGFYIIAFVIFVLVLSNIILGIAIFNFQKRIYQLERITTRANFYDHPVQVFRTASDH